MDGYLARGLRKQKEEGLSMNTPVRARIAILVGLAAFLVSTAPAPAGPEQVAVRLELSQQFFYEGDPLNLRISVHNRDAAKIDNPIKTALFSGLKVRSAGTSLTAKGKATTEEPQRPEKLAPEAFYGTVVNLVDIYPQLASSGTYEIHWSGDGVLSDMIVITVIPRFDPTKSYIGEVETNLGTIVIDLYANQSPIAVKSFVDLAQSGFYEELSFHEVRADDYIVGGDPRFGDRPRQMIQYPAEQTSIPLVAGTVVMRPMRAAPPANGSTFVIMLKPQPSWTGQVTALGQVVRGLDVVQQLSRAPSSMRNSQPNFKPLRDVKIKRVTIREKKPKSAAG